MFLFQTLIWRIGVISWGSKSKEFSKEKEKGKSKENHSPCIFNMDDLESLGTHWVCCWKKPSGVFQYFDNFDLPLPQEWNLPGTSVFERNNNQIQNWVAE